MLGCHKPVSAMKEVSLNKYLLKEFANLWGHQGELNKLPGLRILEGGVEEDLGVVIRLFTSTRSVLQEIQAVLRVPSSPEHL